MIINVRSFFLILYLYKGKETYLIKQKTNMLAFVKL